MKFLEFDSLGSTNAKAHELFQSGERGPLWVRADIQTSGRGRRGRDWDSPKGNLYASALYPWTGQVSEAAKLSFVAAIAVAKALKAYPLTAEPTLKWPNDVLIEGGKISGILLENIGQAVIVGIGVNLVSHPDISGLEEQPYKAAHLLDYIDPAAMSGPEPVFTGAAPFLAVMARHFDDLFSSYVTDGFEPIRGSWMKLASGLPGPVTVRLPSETFTGEAQDLLENGALRVRLSNGTVRDVHAGDVFFGDGNASRH